MYTKQEIQKEKRFIDKSFFVKKELSNVTDTSLKRHEQLQTFRKCEGNLIIRYNQDNYLLKIGQF